MRVSLCRLADLEDPGARSFQLDGGRRWPLALFLVRRGPQVFAYVNRCPHAGHQLNWVGDRFLNRERTHIQCASHGAVFAIESGVCVAGPCPGEKLMPVGVTLEGGEVFIDNDVVRALLPEDRGANPG